MGWVGGSGGVVCKVIFMSNPTSVEVKLGLVDVVVGVVTTIKLVAKLMLAFC